MSGATPATTTPVCPGAPKKPNQGANSLPGVLIRQPDFGFIPGLEDDSTPSLGDDGIPLHLNAHIKLSPSMRSDITPPSSPRTPLVCPGAPRAPTRTISTWGNVLKQQGQ